MKKYARGTKAWGECARSGRKMLLRDMVFDGQYPNLRVDPAWFEPKHPQENLPRLDDPVALWRPAPELLSPPSAPVLSGVLVDVDGVLTWTESESGVSQVDTYLLYRRVNGGPYELLATIEVERDEFGARTSDLTYTDAGLEAGVTYEYYVVGRAYQGGDSEPSNVVELLLEQVAEITLIGLEENTAALFNGNTAEFTVSCDPGQNRVICGVTLIGNFTSDGTGESVSIKVNGVDVTDKVEKVVESVERSARAVLWTMALGSNDEAEDLTVEVSMVGTTVVRTHHSMTLVFDNCNQSDADMSNQYTESYDQTGDVSPESLTLEPPTGSLVFTVAATVRDSVNFPEFPELVSETALEDTDLISTNSNSRVAQIYYGTDHGSELELEWNIYTQSAANPLVFRGYYEAAFVVRPV